VNPPLRRLAIACLIIFGALFVNATWLQVVDAHNLRSKPGNTRVLLAEYEHARGPIVAGGNPVARSVKTNDRLKYLRIYPGGAEYAPATGYYSLTIGTSGIERTENPILSGDDDRLFVRRLSDLVTGRTPQGGAVVLTLDPKAQDAAWKGLDGVRGAVVALDPRTGAILALATRPSYNPSRLTTHNPARINAHYHDLLNAPGDPLLDRALAQTYPPGSTFKVVTSAAALSSGRYSPSTVIPAPNELRLPLTTHKLKNFGGETCSPSGRMTLQQALVISCNTAFAQLGLDLHAAALQRQAEAFGFNSSFAVPLQSATSVFPQHLNRPETALAAIGQFDVRVTPLQMAMVAAGIANHGVVMHPYLVKQVEAPDLSVLESAHPTEVGRAVSAPVADELRQMMEDVVNNGTGSSAQIPGVRVAGKTGTAQHGTGAPHAWFIAFAPAEHPVVAVAVLVENGGSLAKEATGGRVAAPIARSVIEAVLGR
jgi:peptidoglycan glycosyltransferase